MSEAVARRLGTASPTGPQCQRLQETMCLTVHAARRSKARSIGLEVIDRLLEYGTEYNAGNGCWAYFVGQRLPEFDTSPELRACRNKAAVVYGDRVITVHHCARPPRSWRRVA